MMFLGAIFLLTSPHRQVGPFLKYWARRWGGLLARQGRSCSPTSTSWTRFTFRQCRREVDWAAYWFFFQKYQMGHPSLRA